MDAATLSAAVKGKLRAQGDKLQKKVAAEAKAAAALESEAGVRLLALYTKIVWCVFWATSLFPGRLIKRQRQSAFFFFGVRLAGFPADIFIFYFLF